MLFRSKSHSSGCVTHHKTMVPSVVKEMNHCTPENLSFTGRIGTITVPFPGLNDMRRSTQIMSIDIMPTGRVTKNHVIHDGCGCIIWRAMIFCGEAIGESIPPMLEARAIPMMTALDICESEGRLRSMGYRG